MSEIQSRFIPRDISWLSFNYRVLQEAKDPTVPLLERVKFLAIYSNNLDEFYRVRVANLRNLIRLGKKTKSYIEYNPEEILTEVNRIVNEQQQEFSEIFQNQIKPELGKEGINIISRNNLNPEQDEFVEAYFMDHMLPFVQPVLVIKDMVRPFLNNAALYLTVALRDKMEIDHEVRSYAIVKVPSDHLPRFLQLPSAPGKHDVIILDDIVRNRLPWLFPGYDVIGSYSTKLTRDAELYIDDEFSGNLIQKIKKSLSKRNVGPASRFVYDRKMPEALIQFMTAAFQINDFDLVPEGRYHNNMDFFGFPTFNKNGLKNIPLPPLSYTPLESARSIYDAMKEKEHLLNFPFHSYESVIRFFEEAATDPAVTHIKITQYRVAKVSRIMQALMKAVKAGKQVSVFVEIKARFDEANNLKWGERLENAGVKVNYSFPGVKVHAKMAIVRRIEENGPSLYAYLSTGNFHEDTAKIYSDFGFFTTDERLCSEVSRAFSFLETVQYPQTEFKHILVGQFNLRDELERKVENEIAAANAGKEAKILLKMNSLQDRDFIEKLYEASAAGVHITLIVRGICCLVPQVEGLSENIFAYSIVDRFLEHSRVFYFYNGGEEQVYLSSADWMVRNLDHRIETCFPIYDKGLIEEIKTLMDIQVRDNVKSRILDGAHLNTYNRDDSDMAVRSQVETYYWLKRRLDQL